MSTTAAGVHSKISGRKNRDLRRFWRLLIAALIPLGPLGITVGRAVMPFWTDMDGRQIIESTIAHPETSAGMAWLGLATYPAMLTGVLALGYVARRQSPVLATLGATLSFLAFANWNAAGNSEASIHAMAAVGIGTDQIVGVTGVLLGAPIAAVTGFGWLVGHIAGMILAGIALGRSGLVRWWVAIALIVSQPFHFIAAVVIPNRWLDVTLGWGLTTFACLMVSLAILRVADDDWDLPPVSRA